jgi:hypothetical protein
LSSSSAGTSSALIFVAIIVLLVVSRIFRNLRGIKVSEGRTIFYIIFYFVFGGIFIALSFFEGVSYLYLIPDVAAAVFAFYSAYHFADRRIKFWKGPDGSIWYKGGIVIYLIYVVALIARLAVDFLVIGPSAFSFSRTIVALSPTALFGETVTDALLAFGIGLLIGRNIRVYQRYKSIIAGKETVSEMP